MDSAFLAVLPFVVVIGSLYCGWNTWKFFRDMRLGNPIVDEHPFRCSSKNRHLTKRINAALVIATCVAFVVGASVLTVTAAMTNATFQHWFQWTGETPESQAASGSGGHTLADMPTHVSYDLSRPGWPVVRVEFNGSSLTDDDFVRFVRNHPDLELVQLHCTQVTDGALFSSLGELEHLQHLVLDDLDVSDAGLTRVLAARTLKCLWLVRIQISRQGFEAIGRQLQLRELALIATSFRAEDMKHLQDLPQLEELILYCTDLTQEQIADCQKELPDCRIVVW